MFITLSYIKLNGGIHMRITKIEKYKDYPVCDNLLEHGYYSDSLFDQCFIQVTVNIDDNHNAPIYRKLWEDVYIKTSNSITKFNETNELVVGITISEAIGFIYKATPPRFQKSIPDSHKCVDDIIKSLETFLLGDDSILSMLEINSTGGESHNVMNRQFYHNPALYEKMLQTAAINPEKFKGIEYLMKTISKDGIIPEDFKILYETFKKAVRING
jgi:hypothetical protein